MTSVEEPRRLPLPPASPAPRAGGALLAAVVVLVAAVAWVVSRDPALVRFWPFTAGEFVQALTPLVLVALFIERALEVFVTAWRGGGADAIQERVRVGAAPGQAVDYKSSTRRLAFAAAVLIGTAIAAIGVRALELFVDPAVFRTLSPLQQTVFRTADVLLTGAVLGGGADGLHKLVSVFTNFMDSTSAQIKRRGERDRTT